MFDPRGNPGVPLDKLLRTYPGILGTPHSDGIVRHGRAAVKVWRPYFGSVIEERVRISGRLRDQY
jgi:hypothetical protein